MTRGAGFATFGPERSPNRLQKIALLRSPLLLLLSITPARAEGISAAEAPSPGGNAPDVLESPALTDGPEASADLHEVVAMARTNVQGLRRALLPGPGGAIVVSNSLAPIHQSLSVAAHRLDTPIAVDGLEIQVATYGQIYVGGPEDVQEATWDVASAFATQRFSGGQFTLGRQTVAGGAARYRRMDGLSMTGRTDFGLSGTVYGGLTALPRWDQWYGVHHLGDAYEQWHEAPSQVIAPSRGENWMGGFRLGWGDDRIGSVGASFHYQAEEQSVENRNLGINFALTYFDGVMVSGDVIYTVEQARWSDVRLRGEWEALARTSRRPGLLLTGELLHTAPSALLSQASVLSVFSASDVSEAGGGLLLRFPRYVGLELSGHAQLYELGDPGARVRLTGEFKSDERGTLVLRMTGARVGVEGNGYYQLRLAGILQATRQVSVITDLYQYHYDEKIRGRSSSTFAAAHVSVSPLRALRTRLGGSVSQSPYAALDAQVMAELAIQFSEVGW